MARANIPWRWGALSRYGCVVAWDPSGFVSIHRAPAPLPQATHRAGAEWNGRNFAASLISRHYGCLIPNWIHVGPTTIYMAGKLLIGFSRALYLAGYRDNGKGVCGFFRLGPKFASFCSHPG